jgi:hypothetical protein
MGDLVPASGIPTAVAVVVVSAVATAVSSYVAYRISRRRVSPEFRLASAQFSLWWGGVGASVALTGLEVVLAALNVLPFPLAMTFYLISIIIDCAFLWALTGFLIYVYTGRYHLLEVTFFYAAFYAFALYWILAQAPYAVTLMAGIPTIEYSVSPILALTIVILVGLLAPEIGGAIAYLSLLRRTQDHTARYRIALVGSSILLWFALDAFIPGTTTAWVLAKSLLEVIPGLMSLFAFMPPEWARRKFHLETPEGMHGDPKEMMADS